MLVPSLKEVDLTSKTTAELILSWMVNKILVLTSKTFLFDSWSGLKFRARNFLFDYFDFPSHHNKTVFLPTSHIFYMSSSGVARRDS